MSPDDVTPTEAEATTEADEAKPKKSFKERMAFMGKGGEKMDKVPLINKVPRSMRVLFVIIIIVVLIAVFVAVGMMMGGEDKAPDTNNNTINPDKLDDFDWSSGPISGTAAEFQSIQMPLDSILGGNGTVLVESISLSLEWQDEPDQTWAGRLRVNSPDSFQLRIDIGSGNYTTESEMTPNSESSKQGSVSLSLDMSTTNFTYVMVGNASTAKMPEGVYDLPIDLYIIMGEAGDLYAQGPAAFKLNDTGNEYTLTVSVMGKIVPDDDTKVD
jgi:hypothetical protein